MARSRVTSQVSLEGPFFRVDPGKRVRENIRLLTAAAMREAEADVVQQYRHGEGSRRPISSGVRPARVSAHVVGRVTSVAGRPWAVTGVVSINNRGLTRVQGIALMAAAASVERRVRAFRRTTTRMRRARALNEVELLKGLR